MTINSIIGCIFFLKLCIVYNHTNGPNLLFNLEYLHTRVKLVYVTIHTHKNTVIDNY